VLVHCHGDPQVIVRRYRERAERGERHPGHHDLLLVETVAAELAGGVYEPLELGVPALPVDTTIGGPAATSDRPSYAPSYSRVVEFIRKVAGAPLVSSATILTVE
jgi:hypothetical protein